MKIYGIRSCDTCREALRWLSDRGIDHDYVDIRLQGLDESNLRRWQDEAGWEALLNKRSITWRKIPAVDRAGLDADSSRQLILSYPTVLRRPVLEVGENVLLGFEAELYEQMLSSS